MGRTHAGGVSQDMGLVFRARGVRTTLLGLALMAAWTIIVFYLRKSDPAWLINALLWSGEILFFWGAAQFISTNVRRTFRETRLGDRRTVSPGRRASDEEPRT
jgi:hypothetical protein